MSSAIVYMLEARIPGMFVKDPIGTISHVLTVD